MHKSSFRACLFVIVLMSPWAAYAAGLGKLTLNSALGQPLKAEIDIVSVNSDEIASLKASLASHDAFRQAGINYEPFFSNLNISVEPRPNGNPYVKITSPQSVNEPFLNILVELRWPSGRLLREYTVLLDPVDIETSEPIAPTIRAEPVAVDSPIETPQETVLQPDGQADNSNLPASQSAPLEQTSNTYGPANRGDTLIAIAQQITSHGANLNQMLVALYRANRDAFIADNMNLLKVGEVLRIPGNEAIVGIEEAEANAEIKAQASDWHRYREKLARASGESQSHEARKQEDAGQIATTVSNETAATRESPKEVLRLSSGIQSVDNQGETAGDAALDRLRMMEEDSIARNLALKEANERVAMLEKNIENLQRLLELKDPVLAKAQLQAEGAPDTQTTLNSESLAVTTSSNESTPDLALNSTAGQEPAASPQLIVEDAVANQNQLPAAEEVSLMNQAMKNIQYVGGALAIILLGIALLIKRRRKSEREVDADEMDFDGPSSSMRHKIASVAAADSGILLDTDKATHTQTDNDVGNNSLHSGEAEDNKSEKSSDFFPDEIDSDAKTSANMATVSDPLEHDKNWSKSSPELSNEIKFDLDSSADETANEPVNEIDPEFTSEQITSTSQADAIKTKQAVIAENIDLETSALPDSPESPNEITDEADYEFNINLKNDADDGKEIEKAINQSTIPEVTPDNIDDSIAFEPDAFVSNFTDEESADENTLQDTEEKKSNKHDNSDLSVDLPDLHDELGADTDSSIPNALLQAESSFSDIDLDLDDPSAASIDTKEQANEAAMEEDVIEPSEKDEQRHEVATKIDLARAYQEMDDKEGAKEILEEVIREGDAQQQETARSMLADL